MSRYRIPAAQLTSAGFGLSRPVATNPGAALERIANERGWPVLKLFT